MDWEPLEIDHFHLFDDDDELMPEPCLNCYGRGKPRISLSEIRILDRETLQKYGDKNAKPKRGRGRAQLLRERALQRAVGVRDELASQESASLMESTSELDSSSKFNSSHPSLAKSQTHSKHGFMDKWLNSLDGKDVKFSEPNEQTLLPDIPNSRPKSYKHVPKRPVEDYLKIMDNITMKSRGRKSVSRSFRNDSGSVSATPASSMVNESSLEVAVSNVSKEAVLAESATSPIDSVHSIDGSTGSAPKLTELCMTEEGASGALVGNKTEITSDNFEVTDKKKDSLDKEIILNGSHKIDSLTEELISSPFDEAVTEITENDLNVSESELETPKKTVILDEQNKVELTSKYSDEYDLSKEVDTCNINASEEMDSPHSAVHKVHSAVGGETEEVGADDQVQENESAPLVMENLPENCSLTTLLDIAGSYGEIKECNFDPSQQSAVLVYYNQEDCDFAQENLNGEDGFFEDAGKLKAYISKEGVEDLYRVPPK